MSTAAFDIEISSTSPHSARIALFANPSKITQSDATLYSDMFPVPWKVLDFPKYVAGSTSPMPPLHYTSDYKAFVAGASINGVILAASAAPVTPSAKDFVVSTSSSGAVALSLTAPIHGHSSVSIYNGTKKTQNLGVADYHGSPYFVAHTKSGRTIRFEYSMEFAIAVVEDEIEPGQIFDARKLDLKYTTFLADDVTGPVVTIAWDGVEITVKGVKTENHTSHETTFAPHPKSEVLISFPPPMLIQLLMSCVNRSMRTLRPK